MRGTWTAAALALVLLCASWMWLYGINEDNRAAGEAISGLYDFVHADSELQRNVLSARAGILRNYDPIVQSLADMRAAAARIGRAGPEFADDAAVLAATVARAEDIAERFKSANALLQNSLAYFATLCEALQSSDPAVVRGVNRLSTAVFHLTLDTSPGTVARVEGWLDRMPADPHDQPTLDSLLSHARLLATLLPGTDADVDALARLGDLGEVGTVRASILGRQQSLARRADAVRWLLYGLALVLVALLVVVGAKLRGRVRALRHRAAIEHVVAKISMRFLNTPSWNTDAHLALALEELAGCFGASRAYLVLPGEPGRTLSVLRDGPPLAQSWPSDVVEIMAKAGRGDGGIVHIEDVPAMVRRSPTEAFARFGMRTFLCIARMEGGVVRAVLGLDGRRARAFRKFDSGKLLTVAFNALTSAIGKSALEEERERLETHLGRARRMETVGVFASGIAHNFNNIIGAVLGHAEMAAAAAPEGRLAGHIGAIEIAGKRASDLVDQLLTFGRRAEGTRRPVGLDELTGETALLMQSMLPAGVRLSVAQRSGRSVPSAEPAQLSQVLLNLLRNAAQAIDGAGTISLAVEARDLAEGRVVGHDMLEPGAYVAIAVEDDGRGMDAATLGRIFEPFFTTRPEGNGLGLATAREIVRNHHGAIGVESTPGVGTRFEVWLPAARPDDAPARDPLGGDAVERGAGETVLLLDADEERRLRLEDALAALGYEPVGFAEEAAAGAACRAAPGRFDVAVLCASRDGAAAAGGAIFGATQGMPVVLATTSASYGAEALARARIADVIPLPPTYAVLAAALARSLRPRRRRSSAYP